METAFNQSGQNLHVVNVTFSNGSVVVSAALSTTDASVSTTSISNTVSTVAGVVPGSVAVTQGGSDKPV